jgi:hypothetical protein
MEPSKSKCYASVPSVITTFVVISFLTYFNFLQNGGKKKGKEKRKAFKITMLSVYMPPLSAFITVE